MNCTDCKAEGADCLTADRVRVCSDCLYERVVKERDEARKYAEERNDEANKLQRYLNMAAQERDEARAKADRLSEVLLSKHGGEPMALLRELDEARAEVERLRSLKPIGTYSLDWNHEQERMAVARAAYQRGAEAMREAAASYLEEDAKFESVCMSTAAEIYAGVIRSLPRPEDK